MDEYEISDWFPYFDPPLVIDNEQQEDVQIEQSGEPNYLLPFDDAMLGTQPEQPAVKDVEFDFLIDPLPTPSQFDTDALLSQPATDAETVSHLASNSAFDIPELD